MSKFCPLQMMLAMLGMQAMWAEDRNQPLINLMPQGQPFGLSVYPC